MKTQNIFSLIALTLSFLFVTNINAQVFQGGNGGKKVKATQTQQVSQADLAFVGEKGPAFKVGDDTVTTYHTWLVDGNVFAAGPSPMGPDSSHWIGQLMTPKGDQRAVCKKALVTVWFQPRFPATDERIAKMDTANAEIIQAAEEAVEQEHNRTNNTRTNSQIPRGFKLVTSTSVVSGYTRINLEGGQWEGLDKTNGAWGEVQQLLSQGYEVVIKFVGTPVNYQPKPYYTKAQLQIRKTANDRWETRLVGN